MSVINNNGAVYSVCGGSGSGSCGCNSSSGSSCGSSSGSCGNSGGCGGNSCGSSGCGSSGCGSCGNSGGCGCNSCNSAFGGLYNTEAFTLTLSGAPHPLPLNTALPINCMDLTAGAIRLLVGGVYEISYNITLGTGTTPANSETPAYFSAGVLANNSVLPSSASHVYSADFGGLEVGRSTIARLPAGTIINLGVWSDYDETVTIMSGAQLCAVRIGD